MEFTERYDMTRVNYLSGMTFNQMKPYLLQCKNDTERKLKYENIKRFCSGIIKANGTVVRQYHYSVTTPSELGGRLFCGSSIQCCPKDIRGFLASGITTDVDMVNSAPCIVSYLCKKHNIHCVELNNYIKNREEILSQFEDRDTGKKLFLKSINTEKAFRHHNPVFRAFDAEMKKIIKILVNLQEYSDFKEAVPEEKREGNWTGSAMNRILCMFENKILQVALSVCKQNDIDIFAPVFDGFLAYGTDKVADVMEAITDEVELAFPGLNMKWSIKPHSNNITVSEDLIVQETRDEFRIMADEFEKDHAKIIKKSIFVSMLEDGDFVLMTEKAIKTSYAHMSYKDAEGKQKSFISSWLNMNDTQRTFIDMGCFPPGVPCPSGWFNTWRAFPPESMVCSNPTAAKVGVDMILNHIKVLCDHDEAVYNYFVSWIAQMLQFPAVKSTCITLISQQGAGKGTLMTLFERLVGSSRVISTSTPSRDVWGTFNGSIGSAFIVNLDELSKKETVESEGQIKKLITDSRLTINNKGVSQYDINSYHRFIITTNNDDPVKSEKDDRRNLIIRSSDEKCPSVMGQAESAQYFKTLRGYINNDDVLCAIFSYFKSIPGMDNFHEIPIPKTEYQEEVKEQATTPIELWLNYFTVCSEVDSVKMKSSDVFDAYIAWSQKYNKDFKITNIQFAVRLKRLAIPGVKTGVKGKHSNSMEFDFELLREYFKVDEDLEELDLTQPRV